MSKVNTEIIEEFISLQKNLKTIIKGYGISVSHVCRHSDIARATFERKIKKLQFSPNELLRICKVING